MFKRKLFTILSTIGLSSCLLVSTAFAFWYFQGASKASKTATGGIHLDDLKDNYKSVTDTTNTDYTIYFFSQPKVSEYISNYSTNNFSVSKFISDYDSITRSDKEGYFKDSNNHISTSYKVFNNIKRFSPELLSAASQPEYIGDNNNSYSFAGWTTYYIEANKFYQAIKTDNATSIYSSTLEQFIDISKPLSYYDYDSSNSYFAKDYTIFCYPIFIPSQNNDVVYKNSGFRMLHSFSSTTSFNVNSDRSFIRIDQEKDGSITEEEFNTPNPSAETLKKLRSYYNKSYYKLTNLYVSEQNALDGYELFYRIGVNDTSKKVLSSFNSFNSLRNDTNKFVLKQEGLFNIYVSLTVDDGDVSYSLEEPSSIPDNIKVFSEYSFSYTDISSDPASLTFDTSTGSSVTTRFKYKVVVEKIPVLKLVGGPLGLIPGNDIDDASFDYNSPSAITMYPIVTTTNGKEETIFVAEDVYFPERGEKETANITFNVDSNGDFAIDGSLQVSVSYPLQNFIILTGEEKFPYNSATINITNDIPESWTLKDISDKAGKCSNAKWDDKTYTNKLKTLSATYNNETMKGKYPKYGYYSIGARVNMDENDNIASIDVFQRRDENKRNTFIKILNGEKSYEDSSYYDTEGFFKQELFNSSNQDLLYAVSNVNSSDVYPGYINDSFDLGYNISSTDKLFTNMSNNSIVSLTDIVTSNKQLVDRSTNMVICKNVSGILVDKDGNSFDSEEVLDVYKSMILLLEDIK